MKAWPLLLILPPLVALAQTDGDAASSGGIYRVVDENGNVVFTDNPPENSGAEPVRVGPTNTMDSPRPARRELPPPPPDNDRAEGDRADGGDRGGEPFSGYRSLTIVSPDNRAPVRLPQDNPVTVSVQSDPPRLPGHRLEIVDNGAPLDGAVLDFPNPGPHTLRAVIKDERGQPLIASDPITVYVHRSSADGAGSGSALPSVGGASQRGGAARGGGTATGGSPAQRGGGGGLGAPASRSTR
ncbi:MAG TPA: hypothetical protein DEV80_09895 [Alcanivorax sp.]|nr:hypothetical protein [Alcanivorax sp.]HCE40354.1 hypothetical protein [Alcanivorax sp.]|tara:strand:+ start:10016 stop:10738 length:723 start_codon:yes stop_codon:yes gene_type:complete